MGWLITLKPCWDVSNWIGLTTRPPPPTTLKMIKFNFIQLTKIRCMQTCWSVSWPECSICLLLSLLSMGARIALPFISLISFVGGSFWSSFEAVEAATTCCVVSPGRFVKIGDVDFPFDFSLLKKIFKFWIWNSR